MCNMKNVVIFLSLLIVLVTSCVKNERKAFEKAMSEVYSSEIDTFVINYPENGPEAHVYTMSFDDRVKAVMTFLSLSNKVDSIMKTDYPNSFSFPDNDDIQYSWNPQINPYRQIANSIHKIDNTPLTDGHWYADAITVRIWVNLIAKGDDENEVVLEFSKDKEKKK